MKDTYWSLCFKTPFTKTQNLTQCMILSSEIYTASRTTFNPGLLEFKSRYLTILDDSKVKIDFKLQAKYLLCNLVQDIRASARIRKEVLIVLVPIGDGEPYNILLSLDFL